MSHKFIDRRTVDRPQPGASAQPRGGNTPRPQASWGFYPTPRYAGWDNFIPRPFFAQTATRGGLPAYDRWEIMNYGKQLFSQLGDCAGAVIQKNSWSVGEGWDPVFTGREEMWGEEVAAWLREQWYPNCNVRGEPFDFKTTLFLSGMSWDIDGDDLTVFTETDNGFPQIMIIPCQRIGGSDIDDTSVKGGVFDGARIYDGVIYDRRNRPVGYRVANEINGNLNTRFESPDGFTDYPAYNCHLMFEPEWSDQGRGISRFGRPMLDVMNTQDIDKFLMKGVKLDASQGLIITNESGEALDGSETISASEMLIGGGPSGDTRKDEVIADRDYQMRPVSGGEYQYLRANSGEKIESFKSERPHPNTEAFIERVNRRVMLALGWSYDLLDLTAVSGAPSRLLKALAMRTIGDRQRNLKRRAQRAVRYAVCKAIKNGKIPKYYGKDKDGDMLKWDFEMPGEISIDTGNDEQADRENLKIGTTTLSRICAKKGYGDYRNLQAQARKEIMGWVTEALAIEKESGGKINFDKAMDLLTQRTPNGTPLQQMDEAPPAPQPGKGNQP